MSKSALYLRAVHGVITLYFAACLFYIYFVAITGNAHDTVFTIVVCSLTIEFILVFGCNKEDCPLIHIQRQVGDDTPFFALFLPQAIAKRALPIYAGLVLVGLLVIALRFVITSVR